MNIKELTKHINNRITDLEAERNEFIELYHYWSKYRDINKVNKYYLFIRQTDCQLSELKDLLRYIERG